VRISPGFLQEQPFLGSNLITADHKEENNRVFGANCSSVDVKLRRGSPLQTPNSARAAPSEKALLRGASPEFLKNAGAHSSLGNPAPERNSGLKLTRLSAIFKKFSFKTSFKLKINLIQNYLKFSSTQPNLPSPNS
jgi:hypothetical protein